MTVRAKHGQIASVVGSIVVLTLGVAIWYPILKGQGVPAWAHWDYLKENSEHLMLLFVSVLAIATIPERLTNEGRRMGVFWVLALILAFLTALFALARLAQGEPPDDPYYP